jgi:hypothetical protein
LAEDPGERNNVEGAATDELHRLHQIRDRWQKTLQ